MTTEVTISNATVDVEINGAVTTVDIVTAAVTVDVVASGGLNTIAAALDTVFTNPADADIVSYDFGLGKWINLPLGDIGTDWTVSQDPDVIHADNYTDTDTVYDDTAILAAVALNTDKVTNVDHPLVETAVPVGALFTDTVYDDTTIQAEVDLNTAKVTNVAHPLVETAVPVGALFTDTIYSDVTIWAAVDLNTAKVSNIAHPLVETAVPAGAVFTDTTYVASDFDHDDLGASILPNAHINWAVAQTPDIHADNYTDTQYSHPSGDGNLHVPANSTTNEDKVLTASATAGVYTWETPTGGGASAIDDLTDVTITTPATDQVLSYNGSIWINATPVAGVTDHGLLSGLADDDHTQYHTDARANLLYEPIDSAIQTHLADATKHRIINDAGTLTTELFSASKIISALSGKSDTGHSHVKTDITDFNEADYATGAEGDLAVTATQPLDNISSLTNDAGYLTSFSEVNNLSLAVTWANVPDANITSTSVVQHEGDITHNNLTGVSASEHIDWTASQGLTDIHADNYTDTQYTHPTTNDDWHVSDDGTNDAKVLTASAGAGTFTWETPSGGSVALNDLTDVTITGALTGDIIAYNGSAWVDLTAGANGLVLSADNTEPTGLKWISAGGTGDMQASVYDPNTIGLDAFSMTNMTEGATDKILTSAERALIASALQSEVNDLSTVTWVTVPDLYVSASSVTQHVGSIDHDSLLNFDAGEHRIINDAGTLTTELFSASKIISDLSGKSDTGHTHVKANITDFSETDYATGAEGDLATSALQNITGEAIGSLSDVTIATPAVKHFLAYDGVDTWANRVLVEADISDFGTYLTSFTETNDLSAAVTWVNVPDANITESSVIQHVAAIVHDSLSGFVADEHIDWTLTNAKNIHTDNYTDTQYTHPTTNDDWHVSDDGTNNTKVLTASAVAGTFTWETPTGGSGALNDLTDVTITGAAKGDILVYDSVATEWVDLTVGTNGQFLSADSAENTGVKWISASGTGDFLASGAVAMTGEFETDVGTFLSNVADSASAIAYDFDTTVALTTTAKLLAISNNAVEKLSVDINGGIDAPSGHVAFGSSLESKVYHDGTMLTFDNAAGTFEFVHPSVPTWGIVFDILGVSGSQISHSLGSDTDLAVNGWNVSTVALQPDGVSQAIDIGQPANGVGDIYLFTDKSVFVGNGAAQTKAFSQIYGGVSYCQVDKKMVNFGWSIENHVAGDDTLVNRVITADGTTAVKVAETDNIRKIGDTVVITNASGGLTTNVEGAFVITAQNSIGYSYVVPIAEPTNTGAGDVVNLVLGIQANTENTITHADSRLQRFLNNDVEKAYIDKDGSINGLDFNGVALSATTTSITGDWEFSPHGTGGLTDIDLFVGDALATPTYGMIRVGNATFGRTSYTDGANLDLDGSVILWNQATPATSNIEFAFAESSNVIRFAIPKSGVGNATYNPRSMLIAGEAPDDDAMVTVAYWQGQGIFDNLACDTGTTGADLGVQNDLEVEGDIFVDSILESTTAAGVTIDSLIIKDGGVTLAGELECANNDIDNAKTITFNSEIPNSGTGAQTVNWTSGQKQNFTLTGATTISFAAPIGVSNLQLKLINPSTNITWGTTIKWVGGTEPTWTTTGEDIVSIYYDGTNYYGMAGLGFA